MCDSDSDSHSDNTNEEIVEKKEVLNKKVQTELQEMVEEVAESLLNLSNGVSKKKYPLLEKYGIYDMPFFIPDNIFTPINKMTTELFKETLGPKIVKDLNDYEKFHKNEANKQIHFQWLYTNIFYTLALISCLNSTYIKYDLLLYVGYVLYYRWYGSVYCSIFMGSFLSNMVLSSKLYTFLLPNHFWYSLLMVAGSWFAQFYGHAVFERNQPALTTSLTQSFTIAPVHLAVESLERMGGAQEVIEGFLRSQELVSNNIVKFQNWWYNTKNKKD